MPRAFVFLLSALVLGGCGGGDGNSDVEHRGVEAFPDVLEIARAELGDNALVHEVTVSENEISFVNVRFGQVVRVKYDTKAIFTGNDRVRGTLDRAGLFSIADVPADAPARLLAAIQEREQGDIEGLEATLARDSRGELVWRGNASVGGSTKEYTAALDGTLQAA